MSCLHIKNLKVSFSTPLGLLKAVDGVSLDHVDGETLALVGETGCGKSVIARSVMGILPDNAVLEGEIYYEEQNLLKMSEGELAVIRGKEIGIVFQNPSLALNPVHSIGRQIAEPLIVHDRMKKKEALLRAVKLLEKMRFEEAEKHSRMFPFQFSGGMNQRVLIAASVVADPKLLIADEPTKGLDAALKARIVEELEIVKRFNGTSILLITHDFDLAEKLSDRIAIMYAGEILEISPLKDFFSQQMHPYSQALLKSLPDRGFVPIPGASPSMLNPPEGCKFHPRCPFMREICTRRRPSLVKIGGREVRCVIYT